MTGRLSAHRQRAEAAKAEDYAWAIRNEGQIRPDWKALNATIIDEFGHAGLLRIKRLAWRMIEAPAQ